MEVCSEKLDTSSYKFELLSSHTKQIAKPPQSITPNHLCSSIEDINSSSKAQHITWMNNK